MNYFSSKGSLENKTTKNQNSKRFILPAKAGMLHYCTGCFQINQCFWLIFTHPLVCLMDVPRPIKVPSPMSLNTSFQSDNRAHQNTSDLTVITQRNQLDDCIHPGTVAWSDSEGQPIQVSKNPTKPVFLRSCAKLFQAIPLITSNAYKLLTDEELAITCSSHNGSQYHQTLAQKILRKASLNKSHLQCGTHPPIEQSERHRCIREKIAPSALHHNCSGKHAGMLLTCVSNQWPIENYLHAEHPLQQEILSHIITMGQIEADLDPQSNQPSIQTATDGCGVPTFYLPIQKAAQLFAQWSKTSVTEPLRQAISRNPVAFGGADRVDSAIVKATQGKIIAKVGADGLLAACNTQNHQGIAYKIHSGNETYRNIAFCHLLKKSGWLTDKEWAHSALSSHINTTLKNAAGKDIGEILIQ